MLLHELEVNRAEEAAAQAEEKPEGKGDGTPNPHLARISCGAVNPSGERGMGDLARRLRRLENFLDFEFSEDAGA